MQHADHVALIRGGVEGAGDRWLELGAGDGAFTLALADLLPGGAHITTLDLDRPAIERGATRVAARFPGIRVEPTVGDLTGALPAGPWDGILAANSLHFVRDPGPTLARILSALAPDGRLVLVEYDADRGNPWVPHPISFHRLSRVAPDAGLAPPVLLHRVPSRFLGAIYGAVAKRPSPLPHTPQPPVHG